jgi:hypothetical protein
MLTQIFIKGDGCQPEYTKIASHSFGFTGDFFRGAQVIDQLFFAGDYDPVNGTEYPVWSATKYNFPQNYTAGSLNLSADEKSAGIVLPINLVPDDKITLSGTAYYPYYQDWINSGFTSVTLIVGVYYFNCSDENPKLFTFIPVTLTDFDEFGTACFNAEVTLDSSFDFHKTRIVIGYNTYATGDAVTPGSPTILTVSHTLDIERPCKAVNTSFIIKNCCEGSITELVNIPGLVVGDFHVDNEGNCWEVIDTSTDVTNFTRTFEDNYATCLECQDANPCPLNLIISSCCVQGIEYVTGSLPGLVVGDTFVDNHGLCWTVAEETGAPISEESITVDTIIMGDCEACKLANPCPYFYGVQSCCAGIGGIIAVPNLLNEGDAFVDTNGICWRVTKVDTGQLPTIYGIEVDTVYPYQGEGVEPTSCDLCIAANPCPEEYFITIKSCCDNDRVEVAQVPAEFMLFNENTVFNDYWGICWEVLSFNTTGIATFEIWPWNSLPNPNFPGYQDCRQCLENTGCNGAYNIKDCQTDIVYNNVVLDTDGPPSIGGFYVGIILGSFGEILSCFEVLSLGYPTYPGSGKGFLKEGPFATCPECELLLDTTKTLEFSQCCGGPNIIVQYTGSWYTGFGGTAMIPLSEFPEGPYTPTCVTLVGFSTATPTLYNQQNATANYGSCIDCTNQFPCSEL